jgi:hypothetical protein
MIKKIEWVMEFYPDQILLRRKRDGATMFMYSEREAEKKEVDAWADYWIKKF